MIKTHNYYIDFLKAFNAFILNIFNPEVLKTKAIQKIEYNIGSKTLLRHKLYGNESFEYPNAIIDLQDIRVAEGVSTISKNAYGLAPSQESIILCDNQNNNQMVICETQRYILNLNVQVNVETNADMFNFYHIITNHLPINFTFIDFSYYYFIDVTEFVDGWNFEEDDIFNVIKMPDHTERDKIKYFSLLLTQPQLEVQSISKMEDKENNRYAINFSILAAIQIPIILYGNYYTKVDRVIIDVNLDYDDDYPVLIDIELNKYKNVKKSIVLYRDNFKPIYKIIKSDNNENVDDTNEEYKELIGYELELDGKLSNLISLYFNPDILDVYKPILYIPLDSKNIKVSFDENSNKTKIQIYNEEFEKIKEYLTEQYIETNFELIQLLIS